MQGTGEVVAKRQNTFSVAWGFFVSLLSLFFLFFNV